MGRSRGSTAGGLGPLGVLVRLIFVVLGFLLARIFFRGLVRLFASRPKARPGVGGVADPPVAGTSPERIRYPEEEIQDAVFTEVDQEKHQPV